MESLADLPTTGATARLPGGNGPASRLTKGSGHFGPYLRSYIVTTPTLRMDRTGFRKLADTAVGIGFDVSTWYPCTGHILQSSYGVLIVIVVGKTLQGELLEPENVNVKGLVQSHAPVYVQFAFQK